MELGLTPIGVLIKSRRISYLHYLISRDESKMINQLFKAQWHNPTRGDWTESVKSDLEDFDIPIDLEMIKSKSKEVFKKIVKKKAAEYCFRMLLRKKEGHSKMEKLDYMELGIKPYFSLEGLKITEIRELFKFRVRMSNFSENFRGKGGSVNCPLCNKHMDNQASMYQCPVLRKKVDLDADISDVYTDEVKVESIKILMETLRLREKLIEAIETE